MTAIWLLPFYPSPLKDDGYDIADYMNINPDYGTIKDFKEFLNQAHQRGIRVITELVLNHTSDQHEWFQKSRTAPKGSNWRDFYVWHDNTDKYTDARIIFQDFEQSNWTWDPVAGQYFWHRFYSHQPDLNFENTRVHKALFKVIDFWFGMGVDGLRLDAIPYLYEDEGSNCENLPRTHKFLQKLRAHVDSKFEDKMLLAEANQWPEDAVEYFGKGDECHMAFHFPLMPRMFMAIQMESNVPIIDILEQTPQIPDNCQWALFLRNHDELTLEMVTDEERDYMYRVYAQDSQAKINLGIRRRLAPLLLNDRKKIELLNMLLFTMPGTPVIYYGDEIGMGDNYYLGDRDGVRVPMQWTPDRNAGFSKTNPQKLFLPTIIDPEYHFESINVENQENNISSLLWWMKKSIAMRKRYQAFSRGSIEFLSQHNNKVLSFIRKFENETILVIVNISRFPQAAMLDLSEFAGVYPTELFSNNKFPKISLTPYTITLNPFGYYVFQMAPAIEELGESQLPIITTEKIWAHFPTLKTKHILESSILINYIKKCSWFKGKLLKIRKVSIKHIIPFKAENETIMLFYLKLSYHEGDFDSFVLPISFIEKEKSQDIFNDYGHAIISEINLGNISGYIYDGTYNYNYHKTILRHISGNKKLKPGNYQIKFNATPTLKRMMKKHKGNIVSNVFDENQTHASIIFEKAFFLKLFRKVQEGVNPELEITSKASTQKENYIMPQYLGDIQLIHNGNTVTLGILYKFIDHHGNMWNYTQDFLKRYFDTINEKKYVCKETIVPFYQINMENLYPAFEDVVGYSFLYSTYKLGQKTAAMHLHLAKQSGKEYKPESYSQLYQRALFQSLRSQMNELINNLRITNFSDRIKEDWIIKDIVNKNKAMEYVFALLLEQKIDMKKIRIHGDYHLAQVLFTGKDYTIIDFEGNNLLALSERRLKQSPLKDVASMAYSLYYAANIALHNQGHSTHDILRMVAKEWKYNISGIFYDGYTNFAGINSLISKSWEENDILFRAFLIQRAINQIQKEIDRNSKTLLIPMITLLEIVEMFA